MNAILYKLSQPSDQDIITSIAAALHNQQFAVAEKTLLNLVEDIIGREYNTHEDCVEAQKVLKTIYYSFNEMFQKMYGNDITALRSDLHENILIAHCSDPESMDDLLYEASDYVAHVENETQHSEATRHLECYRQNFQEN